MGRMYIFFLTVLSPALGILLALLGLRTVESVWLGWFLFVFGVLYTAGVVIAHWIRKEAFSKEQSGGAAVGHPSFRFILPGLLAAFLASPLEYLYGESPPAWTIWLQPVGAVLVLLGAVLFLSALYMMRLFYSGPVTVGDGQILIRCGPYQVVRYPAYAAFLLVALGVGYASIAGVLAVPLLLLPGLIQRIKLEDHLLAVYFGEQFHQYSARTARLIPRVW